VKHAPTVPQVIEDAGAIGVSLPEEAARRLLVFADLLTTKAVPLGLVSRADAPRVYERHVMDSLRAAPLFASADALALDLGSGPGLPGLVLAVAIPHCRFVLVEPRRIRIGFLELAIETLGLLNAEVAPVRAEDLAGPVDVVTSRAFAPLPRTWGVAGRLLRSSGRLIYFAGGSLDDPAAEAELAARQGLAAEVTTLRVLATSPPLVIMARK
jgi:16S rRNA (guanine527-N7)-methyltransferase